MGGDGDDLLIGGDLSDVLVGGEGADDLRGGEGVDDYVFRAGDGVDEISDSDGQGSVRIGSNALNGAGAARIGGNGISEQWVGQVSGQTVTYWKVGKRWDAQGNVLWDLWIEGGGLANGDRIVIKDYSEARNFGITLDPTVRLALVPGTLPANVWQTPGYTPPTPSVTLPENGSLPWGFAANRPAEAGDYAEVTLSGSGGDHAQAQLGAETASFVNGSLTFALTPGQTLANLALLSFGDFDADEQVTLTVTLRDAQGNAIGTSGTMNVLFDAVDEESPTPVFTLSGDLAPNTYNNPGDPDHNSFIFSFNYTYAGLPYSLGYFFGNVVEGTASPDRADRLIGGDCDEPPKLRVWEWPNHLAPSAEFLS